MAQVRTLAEVASAELDRLRTDTGPSGLPSGLDLERWVPGGIPRDKVTTIFAEAGNFKTTVKNHLLISMAESGHRVLDVSLEDSPELSAHRYLARLSGVPYGAISGGVMSDEQLESLGVPASAKATAERVLCVDSIDPTADNIFQLAMEQRVSAVAVDYVQQVSGHGSLKDRLDDLVMKAQRFSKRHKVAVILVSQQKQDSERGDSGDPRPQKGDALGSSAMRICSKLLIGLFCPSEYCKAPSSTKGPYGIYAKFLSAHPAHADIYPEIVEAIILKNVLGRPNCAVHLRVNRETGLVTNFDEYMRAFV